MEDRKKWIELASKNGIMKNTFLSRVRRGMDPQEAATVPPGSFGRGESERDIPSVELTSEQLQIAKRNGITKAHIRTRLFYGWSVEEAIWIPAGGKREEFQKIKAKEKKRDQAQISKDRADIAAFASEIGLSYGQVVSYLDRGMSKEEIKEKHGKTYERTPHRWAKKEETQMDARKVEVKKETKKEEKAIVKREEVEVKYHSPNFSFLLRDDNIRITLGKSSHLKIEKAMAKELAQALLEIVG